MTITGDYFFLGMLLLGVFLTWFASRRPNILLAFCAALVWFSVGVWLWFSTAPIFGLAENWSKVLVWVFFILTFVPFLLQMDTEIRKEGKGVSWTEWGSKPKTREVDRGLMYRQELKKRLDGLRSRRG